MRITRMAGRTARSAGGAGCWNPSARERNDECLMTKEARMTNAGLVIGLSRLVGRMIGGATVDALLVCLAAGRMWVRSYWVYEAYGRWFEKTDAVVYLLGNGQTHRQEKR